MENKEVPQTLAMAWDEVIKINSKLIRGMNPKEKSKLLWEHLEKENNHLDENGFEWITKEELEKYFLNETFSCFPLNFPNSWIRFYESSFRCLKKGDIFKSKHSIYFVFLNHDYNYENQDDTICFFNCGYDLKTALNISRQIEEKTNDYKINAMKKIAPLSKFNVSELFCTETYFYVADYGWNWPETIRCASCGDLLKFRDMDRFRTDCQKCSISFCDSCIDSTCSNCNSGENLVDPRESTKDNIELLDLEKLHKEKSVLQNKIDRITKELEYQLTKFINNKLSVISQNADYIVNQFRQFSVKNKVKLTYDLGLVFTFEIDYFDAGNGLNIFRLYVDKDVNHWGFNLNGLNTSGKKHDSETLTANISAIILNSMSDETYVGLNLKLIENLNLSFKKMVDLNIAIEKTK